MYVKVAIRTVVVC